MILVEIREPGAGIRWVLLATLMLGACASGAPQPAAVRLGEDACAHCRMTIVSVRTGAQIVSAGGEPLIFDDLACLRDFLAARPMPEGGVVFVADHRTGEWTDARQAVFSRTSEQTPMGSGLMAHATAGSRDADPAAVHAPPVSVAFILQPSAQGRLP